MSATYPSTHLISEAEALRRLNIGPRKGAKLRAAGILTPDQTTMGGHLRLYRADRLTELAAKINPQPAVSQPGLVTVA